MLLSLVINLESQKLVVKAVICPGTELPKCFRGNKELVLEVTTATLQPHPSPEGGRAGVCAMHRLTVPGVTVKHPVLTAWASFGEG